MDDDIKEGLDPLRKFFTVWSPSSDTELAVLKVHLIIEEVLTQIICNTVAREKYVHEARLQFSQKCNIARSINEQKHVPWIWRALELLNKARNELSHNLTADELDRKLEAFIAHVKTHNPKCFESTPFDQFLRFQAAAFATYAPLAAYIDTDL